ncbi:MAG: 3-dehydroquinate synthase [Neisseriaceae bacterium]
MQVDKLIVKTSSAEYPIYFADSLRMLLKEQLGTWVTSQVVVVTNAVVKQWYLQPVKEALEEKGLKPLVVILPDGEAFKNFETLNSIYDALLANHIDRSATIIALGGGVIGDTVGFAAATYQRGVAFIQIPTTLLSQVDSSIGGKTAVNHPLGKNMIGAFYQPRVVLIAQDVLNTLPAREFAAGMAEVIKYALLGDAVFFEWLQENIEQVNQLDLIAVRQILLTCCRMKAEIVSQDEKEAGVRALLNLGHTFAHVIELELGYGNWLHGEAVAIGLKLAARLSYHYGQLTRIELDRIENLLKRAQLPTKLPAIPLERWMDGFQHDKKVREGRMRFVTLEGIGKAVVKATVSPLDLKVILESEEG